jgi:DNA helicase-2/ATP-dependent DNA helicase PcrA
VELNQEQKRVLQSGVDDAIKVVAGAGTGKTRVLVSRYLQFLQKDRIPPERLLALTFTNKAAGEMRKRIFEEVKKLNDPSLARGLYGAWIMNFHGFGRRVLADNADVFGLDPAFDVAGPVDVARIKRRLLAQFEEGLLPGMPEDVEGEPPRPKDIHKRFDKCLTIAGKCRSLLMTPEDLEKTLLDCDHAEYRHFIHTVIAVWHAYKEELRRRGLIDFDDMIEIAARGLRDHPHVRDRYTRRFDHILVDEFQDTSEAQNEFLRILCGGDFGRVTVVGDEKQSIYRWRDARVENIRDFPGGAHVLSRNYRSSQNILDLAHRYICVDEYFGSRQEEIRLESDRGPGGAPVVVFHPPDESGKSFEEEAQALVSWIRHLTEGIPVEGLPLLIDTDKGGAPLLYEDIAVLLRSLRRSSGVRTYEEALLRHNIPYAIVGGANSLETGVLQTFHALLNLVIHPQDVQSLLIVLEAKPFAINDAALVEMFQAAHAAMNSEGPASVQGSHGSKAAPVVDGARRDVPAPAVDVLLSADVLRALGDEAARERCELLRCFIEDLRKQSAQSDLKSFLVEALEDSMYFYQLFADGVPADLAMNLCKEMFVQVDALTAGGEVSLASFLEWLRSRIEDRSFGNAGEALLPPGRVRLMTIHQAKGLEFPAVAVPGIRTSSPQSSGFYLSKQRGIFLGDGDEWGRGYKDLAEREEDKHMLKQEERCLLYVAMTRAKEYLFIASPYPEGEADKGDTQFVDVLACVREGGIDALEIRSLTAPPVARRIPAVHTHSREGGEELSRLEEWDFSRRALQELRREPPVAQPLLTFTGWRALQTFDRCPLKYHYRYVAGMSDELMQLVEDRSGEEEFVDRVRARPASLAPGGMEVRAFGTMMHKILEETMAGNPVTEERIRELITLSGETVQSLNDAAAHAGRVLEAFRRSPLALAERVECLEERFAVRRHRLVLRGVFDRVDRIDGGYRVVDYKYGREREDYDYQICFYVWALRRIFNNKHVEGILLFLGDELRERSVDTDLAAVDKVEEAIDRLESAIAANRFDATPGVVCGDCAFASFCPHAA